MAISSDRPSSRRATLNFEMFSIAANNVAGVDSIRQLGSVRTRKEDRDGGTEDGIGYGGTLEG